MPVRPHPAAMLSEIDPQQFTPEFAAMACRQWQASLNACAATAIPGSALETQVEEWIDQMDTITKAVSNPIIIAGWHSDGYGPEMYRRMCEMEERCYDGVLANLESLEPDNPMRQIVAAYQGSRELMAATGQPSYTITEG